MHHDGSVASMLSTHRGAQQRAGKLQRGFYEQQGGGYFCMEG
jgi:hypothetical protein